MMGDVTTQRGEEPAILPADQDWFTQPQPRVPADDMLAAPGISAVHAVVAGDGTPAGEPLDRRAVDGLRAARREVDQGLDRPFDAGSDRPFDGGFDRSGRGFGGEFGRGFDRASDDGFDQSSDRGFGGGSVRGSGGGFDRASDRGFGGESVRGSAGESERGFGVGFNGESVRGSAGESARGFGVGFSGESGRGSAGESARGFDRAVGGGFGAESGRGSDAESGRGPERAFDPTETRAFRPDEVRAALNEEPAAFDPSDTGTWRVRSVVPGADGGRRNTTILRYLLGLLAVDHLRSLTRWAYAVPVLGLILLVVKPRWIGLAVFVLGVLFVIGRSVAAKMIARRSLARRYRPLEDDLRAATEAGKANLRGELERVGLPSGRFSVLRLARGTDRSAARSKLREVEIHRILPEAQLQRALKVLDEAAPPGR
jgi:hypothetical protein